MKGPRLTDTRSRGMRDGTTRYATGTPCLVKEPRGHAIASRERHRLMAGDSTDPGTTPLVAELLLLAVTLILIIAVSATLFGLLSFPTSDTDVPEIIKITAISHTNKTDDITYAGIVQLKHVDTTAIENREHGLYLSVNGIRQNVVVETLNSHDFISTHHYGVARFYGAGPDGSKWVSGESAVLDIKDDCIRSGDLVTIEIYHLKRGDIVSRSELYAPTVFE